jgi:hypothetical protein|tara:strand:+ start:748 stop:1065 length:318 start_codon:yes stop_codon:yes gene_type:complete
MDDQPSVKQTPEQKDSLCETANRCQEVSDRLAGHGIVFGINYKRNVEQPDGSSVDGLEIMRSLGAELAIMEMMADWYDAKERASEFSEMGRFMELCDGFQSGSAN